MRQIAERFLVGKGVATAGKYAWDLDLNPITPNDLVFFNPVTGKVLAAGFTFSTIPNLGIAQAVDLNGDGYSDALRPVFGGVIPGASLWNVTTEPHRFGFNKIQNFWFTCTEKDTDYSVNVEWRNDDTLDTNLWNQFSYKTLSVRLADYACDSCDNGIDSKEVSCALANQFHGKHILNGGSDSIFLKRAIKTQSVNTGVDVMPILAKEVQYCISSYAGACNDCAQMDSIGGFTIVANGGTIPSDIEITFASTTVPGDTSKSFYSQKDRIIKLINDGFIANNVSGYAIAIEGISGGGRPCTAGFNILINSCESVTVQDGTGADITPCIAEYNPYDTASSTIYAECEGCTANGTFTPTGGLRVVAKSIYVSASPSDRKAWYHTDARITLNGDTNFTQYAFETMQEIIVPENLGVQLQTLMLDQNVTGSGFDYNPSMIDHRGLYQENNSSRLANNSIGINRNGAYTTISFTYGSPWNTVGVNESDSYAKSTSTIAIESSNTSALAAVKAILDPWLASLPAPKPAIVYATDSDQTNIIVDATGTVTQEAVDDTGSVA